MGQLLLVKLFNHLAGLSVITLAATSTLVLGQTPSEAPKIITEKTEAPFVENASTVFTRNINLPEYPRDALRNGAEANVIVHITMDAECKPGKLRFIAIEAPKRNLNDFKAAVEKVFNTMAPACNGTAKPPFIVEQQFMFSLRPTERTRYGLVGGSMALAPLLSLFEAPPSIGPIDLRSGKCGMDVNLHPLMPETPNRITKTANNELPLPEMVYWLSQLSLKKERRLDFLGKTMPLTIPCATLDFSKPLE